MKTKINQNQNTSNKVVLNLKYINWETWQFGYLIRLHPYNASLQQRQKKKNNIKQIYFIKKRKVYYVIEYLIIYGTIRHAHKYLFIYLILLFYYCQAYKRNMIFK